VGGGEYSAESSGQAYFQAFETASVVGGNLEGRVD
jgi:hypothetical protein